MSFHYTASEPLGQIGDGIYMVSKNRGETLAVLLDRVRAEHCVAPGVPMTYAGRLDPMAEGLVIMLSGEQCKQKDSYLGLDKTYQFEVLLGVNTDTADVLGLASCSAPSAEKREYSLDVIASAVENLAGDIEITYPMYSSKTVDGKPLFAYAREGSRPEHMPTKRGFVRSISVNSIRAVPLGALIQEIIIDVSRVEGDFRQDSIVQKWKEIAEVAGDTVVQIVSCTATVTSGVYIRSLAEMIGASLGVPALAYRIDRIEIGSSVQ